jgi:hypothetical protein
MPALPAEPAGQPDPPQSAALDSEARSCARLLWGWLVLRTLAWTALATAVYARLRGTRS